MWFNPYSLALTCPLWLLSFSHAESTQTQERSPPGRERISLNTDWRFSRFESIPDGVTYAHRPGLPDTAGTEILKPWILPSANEFINDPSEQHQRPAEEPLANISFVQKSFDDDAWERVHLPHDWAIKGPFYATSRDEVMQFTKSLYPTLRPAQLKSISKAYPRFPPVPRHAAYFPTASAILTDISFTCPGFEMTRSASLRGSTHSWNYRYNVQDPTSLAMGWGVPHIVETTAIFGLDYGGSIGFPSLLDTNAPIIPIVMNYFISFVRELDPKVLKHEAAPVWQPWRVAHQRLKIETNDTVMERGPRDHQARCALFKNLAPTTKQ